MLLERKSTSRFGRLLQISTGSLPVRRLRIMASCLREVMLKIDGGIEPVNRLPIGDIIKLLDEAITHINMANQKDQSRSK